MIESFSGSITDFNEFLKDLKTQSAVERQLGIIGEAVNKFESLNPENSLKNSRKIVGLRNRLIHAYDAIDSSMVWVIIKRHLSPLKDEIIEMIK